MAVSSDVSDAAEHEDDVKAIDGGMESDEVLIRKAMLNYRIKYATS